MVRGLEGLRGLYPRNSVWKIEWKLLGRRIENLQRNSLRSNFISRGVGSRVFLFLEDTSAPRRLTGARIGGNQSYRPPGPF